MLTRPAEPKVPVTPYFFVLYAAFRAASTFSSFLIVVTANSCSIGGHKHVRGVLEKFSSGQTAKGLIDVHRLSWIMASYHPISCSGGDVQGLVVLENARLATVKQICMPQSRGQRLRGMCGR